MRQLQSYKLWNRGHKKSNLQFSSHRCIRCVCTLIDQSREQYTDEGMVSSKKRVLTNSSACWALNLRHRGRNGAPEKPQMVLGDKLWQKGESGNRRLRCHVLTRPTWLITDWYFQSSCSVKEQYCRWTQDREYIVDIALKNICLSRKRISPIET